MFSASVPLWLVLLLIVLAILVTFWAQRYWFKKDPVGYEAWAARAKVYGVDITEKARGVRDRFKTDDTGDG